MRKTITTVILLISLSVASQNVDILDKNRKVLKTVSEKHLKRTVDSIGQKARYTARWINYGLKERCIKWGLEDLLI